MSFPNLTVTNEGKAAMLKVIEGDTLTFTRIGLGNGPRPNNIEELTEMQNVICYGEIASYQRNGQYAIIHWQLDCSAIPDEFFWTEYALFAKNSDNNEFLFSYSYDGVMPQPLSAVISESLAMIETDINICVGTAENVNAVIGEYSAYASKEDFLHHIDNENNPNPHNVTKSDIGLENVENVSTNNAKPTFTEASTLANVNSGESVSTLWGKVKKAISSLTTHINNKSNPHSVTAAQVGAAATSHNHSASNINSGTLSEARGGTGKSSISDFLTSYGLNFFRIKSGSTPTLGDDKWIIPLQNGVKILVGRIDCQDISGNRVVTGRVDYGSTINNAFVLLTIDNGGVIVGYNAPILNVHTTVITTTNTYFNYVVGNKNNDSISCKINYIVIGK